MGYLVERSIVGYTVEMLKGSSSAGYLVVAGLLIVACAMFFSTATLAAMKARQKESLWAQSRTQELAAARSATAILVNQFNRAGKLTGVGQVTTGQVGTIPYTATLTQDPDTGSIFLLTAKVGDTSYTRVLREEPKRNHVAYTRVGQLRPKIYSQDSVGAVWKEIPLPPNRPGESDVTVAIAANYEDQFFMYRLGEDRFRGFRRPYVSQFDRESSTWSQLPPVPYNPVANWLSSGSSADVATIGHQSMMSVNDQRLFLMVGPNLLANRRAPQDVAQFFIYNIPNRSWTSVPLPTAEVYQADGQLVPEPDVTINRITANEGNFLLETSSGLGVATLTQYRDSVWTVLPPIPTGGGFGRPHSIAAGPEGEVSLITKERASGDMNIVRLEDGHWVVDSAPPGAGTLASLTFDAQGREWYHDLVNQRSFQGANGNWTEYPLPVGANREVETGAEPDDELYYYQTTAGY